MKCDNCDSLAPDHSSKVCSRCRWEVRSIVFALALGSFFIAAMGVAVLLGVAS